MTNEELSKKLATMPPKARAMMDTGEEHEVKSVTYVEGRIKMTRYGASDCRR